MSFQYIARVALDILKKFFMSFTKEGVFGSAAMAVYLATAGIHNLYGAVIMFVFADCLTGTWASIHKGEGFRSRRFYEGAVAKLFVHMMMLTLFFKLDHVFQAAIPISTNFLSVLIAICICVYEFSSIVENVTAIFPNMTFLVSLSDMLKRVVKKRTEQVEDVLDGPPPAQKDESQKPDQVQPQ